MASHQLSLRLDDNTFDRLDEESRRTSRSRSQLARSLLEEGLRMQAYPGVIFRSGPAGRRPGLAGGPDLWEVVRVFQGVDAEVEDEDALRRVAERTGLRVEQVRTVLSYYAGYPDEINAWIQNVDDEAARAEAAWRHEQSLPE